MARLVDGVGCDDAFDHGRVRLAECVNDWVVFDSVELVVADRIGECEEQSAGHVRGGENLIHSVLGGDARHGCAGTGPSQTGASGATATGR